MSGINFEWNKILITGGGGGLGLALAKYYLSKGKKVVIAGRTEANLKAAVDSVKSPDLSYVVVDLAKLDTLSSFVKKLLSQHPDIDAVLNNAGIQKTLSYADAKTDSVDDLIADSAAEVTTNITAVLQLTSLLLPHLLGQPKAAVMAVTSGLAFVPFTPVPVYCATKAFVHSWLVSLRMQLAKTSVRVIEIAPPLVETDLHRDHANPEGYSVETNKQCMSQADFIAGVDEQFSAGKEEVAVGFAAIGSSRWHEAFDGPLKTLNTH